MQGLSFREYLKLFHDKDVPLYSLEDILAQKAQIPDVRHPLPFFQNYLRRGYYPFSQDINFEIIDNTSLAYLLGGNATDIGNIRETFFYNQMRVTTDVISSRISDFEINGKTFEVGGKKKGKKQISHADEGYIVRDDIELGNGNIIPLWAFGLTY